MPTLPFTLAIWLALGQLPGPPQVPKEEPDPVTQSLRKAGLGSDAGVEGATEGGASKPAPGTAGDEARWRRLDALFDDRDREGAIAELEQSLHASLQEAPDSFEALWRLSRLRYWVADNAPGKETKKRLGKEGWSLGDRAAKARPDRAEGHYYAAINIGSYGAGAGVWAALTEGLESAFKKRIERAIAIDPWLDRGGPLVALGRYHASMPWPKTDNRRARQLYDRVLEKYPQNLRALHYRSQLEQREGHLTEASQDVQRVQRGGGEDPAEDRRVQRWSRRVARELAGGR